jgi:hypothetical protein
VALQERSSTLKLGDSWAGRVGLAQAREARFRAFTVGALMLMRQLVAASPKTSKSPLGQTVAVAAEEEG